MSGSSSSRQEIDTEEGVTIKRWGVAIEPATEGSTKGYYTQKHIQDIVDLDPTRTFRGYIEALSEEGDLWRIRVASGRATELRPLIVWPEERRMSTSPRRRQTATPPPAKSIYATKSVIPVTIVRPRRGHPGRTDRLRRQARHIPPRRPTHHRRVGIRRTRLERPAVKIIRELLAEAVQTCTDCNGSGRWGSPLWLDDSPIMWCYHCHGTGKQLTPEGAELVGFAAHWLKPHFASEDHFHGADHEHDV